LRVCSIFRIVSLRLPSIRLITEKLNVGGCHVTPLKKLNGARLILPSAPREHTQAIGLGMMALLNKSCASRGGILDKSISLCAKTSPLNLYCYSASGGASPALQDFVLTFFRVRVLSMSQHIKIIGLHNSIINIA
jgi:hypothetical protein